MKINFKHALLLLGFYSNAYGQECKKPFAELPKRFLLQEKLDCNALQERVTLRIGNPSEAGSFKDIGPSSYFLKPVCTGQTKSINLNYNADKNEIINWGDVRGSKQESFFITPTCNGGTPFAIMSAYQREIQLNGTKQQVGFTSTPPFVYVLESENAANEVTLRSYNGAVVAHAKKTFVNGPTCYANWDVNYTDIAYEYPAISTSTLISYVLAWKDNSNLNCSILPPTISNGAVAGITAFTLVATAAIVAGIVGMYYRAEIGNFYWAYERIED